MRHTFTNEKQWLEFRREHITATDVVDICLRNRALAVYERKVNGDTREDTRVFARGRIMQKPIIELYKLDTGVIVSNNDNNIAYTSDQFEWLSATPDGFIDNYTVAEIKTAQRLMRDEFPSDDFILQSQTQMICADVNHGLIVGLLNYYELADFKHTLHREWFENEIIPVVAEFRERVIHQDPPPPDDSEDSFKTVKKMYKPVDGKRVSLAGYNYLVNEFETVELDLKYKRADVRTLEKQLRALKSKLYYHLGDCSVGEMGNGKLIVSRETKKSRKLEVVYE